MDSNYNINIWNKVIMYNKQTVTLFISESVTALSDNKPRERQRGSNNDIQRQIHARSHGGSNDAVKMMKKTENGVMLRFD